MKVYYDADANLETLKQKKIAILGYGSQGHAHAQNLRDSGMQVIIAEVKGGEAWKNAEAAGFTVVEAAEAVKAANVIMILCRIRSRKRYMMPMWRRILRTVIPWSLPMDLTYTINRSYHRRILM